MIQTLMHYTVVFDVMQTGFRHWLAVVGAVVGITLAIGFLWYKRRAERSFTGSQIRWPEALLLFSLMLIFMLVDGYQDYIRLKSAMQQSQCQITEGIVTKFRPQSRHFAASF